MYWRSFWFIPAIDFGKIKLWTILGFAFAILHTTLILILSTAFEICLAVVNPCVSGLDEYSHYIRYVSVYAVHFVNLSYCLLYDVRLVKLVKSRQRVKPIKMRQWSTKKKIPPKNQEMFSTTIPLSASAITLCKFLMVFIHGIRVEFFGHNPQNIQSIIGFPLIVLLDMPITLLLTVRSNEKKKAIVVPPTGLQDDGEEFYYISKMRTKSKTFKRRWSTNLDPNDCVFIPDRMLMEIKRKKRKCSF